MERNAEASRSKISTRRRTRGAAKPERRAAITPEERRRMIAESAYYRAERRGFQDGKSDQDWYEAEAEIDRMLIAGRGEK